MSHFIELTVPDTFSPRCTRVDARRIVRLEPHPGRAVTLVHLDGGGGLLAVYETPDQIEALIARALAPALEAEVQEALVKAEAARADLDRIRAEIQATLAAILASHQRYLRALGEGR